MFTPAQALQAVDGRVERKIKETKAELTAAALLEKYALVAAQEERKDEAGEGRRQRLSKANARGDVAGNTENKGRMRRIKTRVAGRTTKRNIFAQGKDQVAMYRALATGSRSLHSRLVAGLGGGEEQRRRTLAGVAAAAARKLSKEETDVLRLQTEGKYGAGFQVDKARFRTSQWAGAVRQAISDSWVGGTLRVAWGMGTAIATFGAHYGVMMWLEMPTGSLLGALQAVGKNMRGNLYTTHDLLRLLGNGIFKKYLIFKGATVLVQVVYRDLWGGGLWRKAQELLDQDPGSVKGTGKDWFEYVASVEKHDPKLAEWLRSQRRDRKTWAYLPRAWFEMLRQHMQLHALLGTTMSFAAFEVLPTALIYTVGPVFWGSLAAGTPLAIPLLGTLASSIAVSVTSSAIASLLRSKPAVRAVLKLLHASKHYRLSVRQKGVLLTVALQERVDEQGKELPLTTSSTRAKTWLHFLGGGTVEGHKQVDPSQAADEMLRQQGLVGATNLAVSAYSHQHLLTVVHSARSMGLSDATIEDLLRTERLQYGLTDSVVRDMVTKKRLLPPLYRMGLFLSGRSSFAELLQDSVLAREWRTHRVVMSVYAENVRRYAGLVGAVATAIALYGGRAQLPPWLAGMELMEPLLMGMADTLCRYPFLKMFFVGLGTKFLIAASGVDELTADLQGVFRRRALAQNSNWGDTPGWWKLARQWSEQNIGQTILLTTTNQVAHMGARGVAQEATAFATALHASPEIYEALKVGQEKKLLEATALTGGAVHMQRVREATDTGFTLAMMWREQGASLLQMSQFLWDMHVESHAGDWFYEWWNRSPLKDEQPGTGEDPSQGPGPEDGRAGGQAVDPSMFHTQGSRLETDEEVKWRMEAYRRAVERGVPEGASDMERTMHAWMEGQVELYDATGPAAVERVHRVGDPVMDRAAGFDVEAQALLSALFSPDMTRAQLANALELLKSAILTYNKELDMDSGAVAGLVATLRTAKPITQATPVERLRELQRTMRSFISAQGKDFDAKALFVSEMKLWSVRDALASATASAAAGGVQGGIPRIGTMILPGEVLLFQTTLHGQASAFGGFFEGGDAPQVVMAYIRGTFVPVQGPASVMVEGRSREELLRMDELLNGLVRGGALLPDALASFRAQWVQHLHGEGVLSLYTRPETWTATEAERKVMEEYLTEMWRSGSMGPDVLYIAEASRKVREYNAATEMEKWRKFFPFHAREMLKYGLDPLGKVVKGVVGERQVSAPDAEATRRAMRHLLLLHPAVELHMHDPRQVLRRLNWQLQTLEALENESRALWSNLKVLLKALQMHATEETRERVRAVKEQLESLAKWKAMKNNPAFQKKLAAFMHREITFTDFMGVMEAYGFNSEAFEAAQKPLVDWILEGRGMLEDMVGDAQAALGDAQAAFFRNLEADIAANFNEAARKAWDEGMLDPERWGSLPSWMIPVQSLVRHHLLEYVHGTKADAPLRSAYARWKALAKALHLPPPPELTRLLEAGVDASLGDARVLDGFREFATRQASQYAKDHMEGLAGRTVLRFLKRERDRVAHIWSREGGLTPDQIRDKLRDHLTSYLVLNRNTIAHEVAGEVLAGASKELPLAWLSAALGEKGTKKWLDGLEHFVSATVSTNIFGGAYQGVVEEAVGGATPSVTVDVPPVTSSDGYTVVRSVDDGVSPAPPSGYSGTLESEIKSEREWLDPSQNQQPYQQQVFNMKQLFNPYDYGYNQNLANPFPLKTEWDFGYNQQLILNPVSNKPPEEWYGKFARPPVSDKPPEEWYGKFARPPASFWGGDRGYGESLVMPPPDPQLHFDPPRRRHFPMSYVEGYGWHLVRPEWYGDFAGPSPAFSQRSPKPSAPQSAAVLYGEATFLKWTESGFQRTPVPSEPWYGEFARPPRPTSEKPSGPWYGEFARPPRPTSEKPSGPWYGEFARPPRPTSEQPPEPWYGEFARPPRPTSEQPPEPWYGRFVRPDPVVKKAQPQTDSPWYGDFATSETGSSPLGQAETYKRVRHMHARLMGAMHQRHQRLPSTLQQHTVWETQAQDLLREFGLGIPIPMLRGEPLSEAALEKVTRSLERWTGVYNKLRDDLLNMERRAAVDATERLESILAQYAEELSPGPEAMRAAVQRMMGGDDIFMAASLTLEEVGAVEHLLQRSDLQEAVKTAEEWVGDAQKYARLYLEDLYKQKLVTGVQGAVQAGEFPELVARVWAQTASAEAVLQAFPQLGQRDLQSLAERLGVEWGVVTQLAEDPSQVTVNHVLSARVMYVADAFDTDQDQDFGEAIARNTQEMLSAVRETVNTRMEQVLGAMEGSVLTNLASVLGLHGGAVGEFLGSAAGKALSPHVAATRSSIMKHLKGEDEEGEESLEDVVQAHFSYVAEEMAHETADNTLRGESRGEYEKDPLEAERRLWEFMDVTDLRGGILELMQGMATEEDKEGHAVWGGLPAGLKAPSGMTEAQLKAALGGWTREQMRRGLNTADETEMREQFQEHMQEQGWTEEQVNEFLEQVGPTGQRDTIFRVNAHYGINSLSDGQRTRLMEALAGLNSQEAVERFIRRRLVNAARREQRGNRMLAGAVYTQALKGVLEAQGVTGTRLEEALRNTPSLEHTAAWRAYNAVPFLLAARWDQVLDAPVYSMYEHLSRSLAQLVKVEDEATSRNLKESFMELGLSEEHARVLTDPATWLRTERGETPVEAVEAMGHYLTELYILGGDNIMRGAAGNLDMEGRLPTLATGASHLLTAWNGLKMASAGVSVGKNFIMGEVNAAKDFAHGAANVLRQKYGPGSNTADRPLYPIPDLMSNLRRASARINGIDGQLGSVYVGWSHDVAGLAAAQAAGGAASGQERTFSGPSAFEQAKHTAGVAIPGSVNEDAAGGPASGLGAAMENTVAANRRFLVNVAGRFYNGANGRFVSNEEVRRAVGGATKGMWSGIFHGILAGAGKQLYHASRRTAAGAAYEYQTGVPLSKQSWTQNYMGGMIVGSDNRVRFATSLADSSAAGRAMRHASRILLTGLYDLHHGGTKPHAYNAADAVLDASALGKDTVAAMLSGTGAALGTGAARFADGRVMEAAYDYLRGGVAASTLLPSVGIQTAANVGWSAAQHRLVYGVLGGDALTAAYDMYNDPVAWKLLLLSDTSIWDRLTESANSPEMLEELLRIEMDKQLKSGALKPEDLENPNELMKRIYARFGKE